VSEKVERDSTTERERHTPLLSVSVKMEKESGQKRYTHTATISVGEGGERQHNTKRETHTQHVYPTISVGEGGKRERSRETHIPLPSVSVKVETAQHRDTQRHTHRGHQCWRR